MTRYIDITHHISKEIIVKSLFSLLALLVIMYSLTLLSLTGNAISLKKVSLQIKHTDIEIAKVERGFSKVLTDINASDLSVSGFASVSNSSFAIKKDPIATFSVLYEKR